MSETLSEHEAFGHWLSGFCDGEASFNLNMGAKQVSSQFTLKLRADEVPILEEIRSFWRGIGSLTVQKTRSGHLNPMAVYQVAGINDLPTVVEHFERFPLRSRKARDFVHWRAGVNLHAYVAQQDFRRRGYNQGVFPKWTRYTLDAYEAHAKRLHADRVFREDPLPLPNLHTFDEAWKHWLAGFIAGEGCLLLDKRMGVPRARLQIKLRVDDLPLLVRVQSFFGGGSLCRAESCRSKPCSVYQVASRSILHERVVPFLQAYRLRARKEAEISIWTEGALLIQGYRRWPATIVSQFLDLAAALKKLRQYRPEE